MLSESNKNFLEKLIKVYENRLKKAKIKNTKMETDMSKLVVICNKILKNNDLSLNEIEFIYEKNGKIQTDWKEANKNNRRIWLSRDIMLDFQKMYNYNDSEITDNIKEYMNNPTKYKCFVGDMIVEDDSNFILPEHLVGSLTINMKNAKTKLPKIIEKHLIIKSLKFPTGLILPNRIGNNLEFIDLNNTNGLELNGYIGGNVMFYKLLNCNGFKLPNSIGGKMYFKLLPHEYLNYMKFSDDIKYKMFFSDKMITPENLEEIKNKKIK